MLKRSIIKAHDTERRAVNEYERDALERLVHATEGGGEEPLDPAAVLAEARNQAERKIREAYEEGMRRGIEEGRSRFNESVSGAAEMLQQAAGEMQAARERFLLALEPQVVTLAFMLAERILHREAQVDRELVLKTARVALEQIVAGERITVRVSPQDAEALRKYKVTLLEDFDGINQLDIIPDSSVSPGGCIVDSELAHVDARIESQLENLFENLQE